MNLPTKPGWCSVKWRGEWMFLRMTPAGRLVLYGDEGRCVGELRDLDDVEFGCQVHPGPAVDTGWQPIETAPRDGTDILTYCQGARSVRYWGRGEDDEMAWLPRIRGQFPTHWMPLPEPT